MMLLHKKSAVDATIIARSLWDVRDLSPPKRRPRERTRENGFSHPALVAAHRIMNGLMVKSLVRICDDCCERGAVFYELTELGRLALARAGVE